MTAIVTISTADRVSVRSSVTPAATAILPSVSAINKTAPDFNSAFLLSIKVGKSRPVTPCKTSARNNFPATFIGAAVLVPAPPDSAKLRRRSVTSFLRVLRSSTSCFALTVKSEV